MKIFVSWSGERSRRVAELLNGWIPSVIQSAQVFVSFDIAKGAQWLAELTRELESTVEGIICLTPENVGEPWINYKAGAIANSAGDSSVRTILLDLDNSRVSGPLATFQHTQLSSKDDMRRFVESIRSKIAPAVDAAIVGRAFEREWADFVEAVQRISSTRVHAEPPRDDSALIGETLEIVRGIARDLAQRTAHSDEGEPGPTGKPPRRHSPARLAELEATLQPSVRVFHETFGPGDVVAVRGSSDRRTIVVKFDNHPRAKTLHLVSTPIRLAKEDDPPF